MFFLIYLFWNDCMKEINGILCIHECATSDVRDQPLREVIVHGIKDHQIHIKYEYMIYSSVDHFI